MRHHAFKPNCASVYQWGGDSYEFFTNSLGFRDERIREVPLADARPRILVLGDSFTEGKLGWRDSYVGKIAEHFPQYDFLNGGVASYSPSNYLNVTRMVLAAGVDIDEVIVFIDISDVQDEATFYRDANDSGAVTGPQHEGYTVSWWPKVRTRIAGQFMLTNYMLAMDWSGSLSLTAFITSRRDPWATHLTWSARHGRIERSMKPAHIMVATRRSESKVGSPGKRPR